MAESKYLHKSHNGSAWLYHVVCAAQYRRGVCSEQGDEGRREAGIERAKRYALVVLEIGTDRHPGHFLIQSVPT